MDRNFPTKQFYNRFLDSLLMDIKQLALWVKNVTAESLFVLDFKTVVVVTIQIFHQVVCMVGMYPGSDFSQWTLYSKGPVFPRPLLKFSRKRPYIPRAQWVQSPIYTIWPNVCAPPTITPMCSSSPKLEAHKTFARTIIVPTWTSNQYHKTFLIN